MSLKTSQRMENDGDDDIWSTVVLRGVIMVLAMMRVMLHLYHVLFGFLIE